MHSRFEIPRDGADGASSALDAWTRLRELNEDVFSSRAELLIAYRDLRAFFVRTDASATPMLSSLRLPGPSIDPFEHPEMALAELFFIVSAEAARNAALSSWMRDYDQTCRKAYERIMPLIRDVGESRLANDGAIHLRHWYVQGHGVYLEALNQSGHTLRNATLLVRLQTLDGSSCDHYFFIKDWPSETSGSEAHRYPIRIASDWTAVGAASTTSAIVEVVADEQSVLPMRVSFDDHIPTAADRLMDEHDRKLKARQQPAIVLRQSRSILGVLGAFPDRRGRAIQQQQTAQSVLDSAIATIEKQIDGLESRIERTRGRTLPSGRRTEGNPEARRKYQQQIRELKRKIADLKAGRI